MKDCSVKIIVKNDVVKIEGEQISMEELATLSGYLQVFVGVEGIKRGGDLEDIKGNMLDIHLSAMEALEEVI